MILYKSLKNIGKAGIIFTALFGMLTLGNSYADSDKAIKKDDSIKYMIIYTGSSHRVLSSYNDKNAWWISTANIYEQALKNGYLQENIFVLYNDGNPDFSDPKIKSIKDTIKKEFQGDYSNIASKENLFKIEESIEQKIRHNDILTLSFNMHGRPYLLFSEYDQEYIEGEEISEMLKDNNSKNNLIVIDACYSESMIKFLDISGTIITSCRSQDWGWVDRDFSFGALFFKNKNNLTNDSDKDGIVDDEEVFKVTKKEYQKIGNSKKECIKKQWAKKGATGAELKTYMDMYNFVPVMVKK